MISWLCRIIGLLPIYTASIPDRSLKCQPLMQLWTPFRMSLAVFLHLAYLYLHSYHQQPSVSELFQDKLRVQLELCDVVSGVLLLEDTSLGWDVAALLCTYLQEEGVKTLFTVGVRSSSSPFDQALSTLSALRASSMFTSSSTCSSLTACCIDSATAV